MDDSLDVKQKSVTQISNLMPAAPASAAVTGRKKDVNDVSQNREWSKGKVISAVRGLRDLVWGRDADVFLSHTCLDLVGIPCKPP